MAASSSSSITLYEVKLSHDRDEYYRLSLNDVEMATSDNRIPLYASRTFGKMSEFFKALDDADDDALCALKIKDKTFDDTEFKAIKSFLSTHFAKCSDQEFLECDVYEVSESCHKVLIRKRLNHIAKRKKGLLQIPKETSSLPKSLFIKHGPKTLTLRQFRNLKSEDEINRAFRKWNGIWEHFTGLGSFADLEFLSFEQKKLVTKQKLFDHILRTFSRPELTRYMLQMDKDLLTKRVKGLNPHYLLSRIPVEVMANLHIDALTDEEIRSWMRYNERDLHKFPVEALRTLRIDTLNDVQFRVIICERLQSLHALGLDGERVKKIVNRLAMLASKKTDIFTKLCHEPNTQIQVPFVPPDMFDLLPDEAMKLIEFENLSKQVLLSLFCTWSEENLNKIGFFIEHQNDGALFVIGGSFQVNVQADNIFYKLWEYASKVEHEAFLAKRRQTLQHRFGLMCVEQYSKIRDRLDPEAREIGDSVHL